MNGSGLDWAALALTLVIMLGYEARLHARSRRAPEQVARSAHGRLRADWVAAMSRERGMEIVAVQLLRNSLMSATINASTAAIALVGTLSLQAGRAVAAAPAATLAALSVRGVLDLLLASLLFAAFVCSSMAMRYYHHAGYAMSMPVGSPERERRLPLAQQHLQRAGVLYSWGLRFFLLLAPALAGLLHPWLMPPAAVALVAVMHRFDQAARAEGD